MKMMEIQISPKLLQEEIDKDHPLISKKSHSNKKIITNKEIVIKTKRITILKKKVEILLKSNIKNHMKHNLIQILRKKIVKINKKSPNK